jgi:hypothetical protein
MLQNYLTPTGREICFDTIPISIFSKKGFAVPLDFRGVALIDPPARGVRFAGYPRGGREGAIVICEVTVEALRTLGGLPDATPDELMGVFEIHKETIFQVASAKFDEGAHRPRITSGDLEFATT